jgi:hypothetical protein
MKKITKLILKIILWIIGMLIALDLLIVTLIFIPPIQQFTVLKVSKLLTNLTGGEITVDKIYLTPSLTLKATNFAIKDHHHNNMIFATKLKGKIHLAKTGNGQVCLSFAQLDDGEVILRKYSQEDEINIALWAKGFKKNKEKKSNFKLLFHHIALNNVRFALVLDDKRQYLDEQTIDYGFFELQHIHLDVDDFLVLGPDISCKINSLTLSQHTGFKISEFSGNFRIYAQGLTIDSLHFKTPNSIFNGDFAFSYNGFSDYSDFVNLIQFNTKVKSATIAMQDVIYFAPALKGMDNQFIFSGYVGGTVNHLQTKNMYAKFKQQTHIIGDFAIENILDFKNSIFDFYIKDSYISFSELAQFKLPRGKTIALPASLNSIAYSKVQGTYKGSFPKFDADITAQTNLGTLKAEIQTDKNGNTLAYTGALACNDLKIGKLLKQPKYLNTINFRSTLEGEAKHVNKIKDLLAGIALTMKGRISAVDVCGYPLKDIAFRGIYAQQKIDLALRSRDSLASFNIHGYANFAKELPKIEATLAYVDFKVNEFFSYYPLAVDSTSAEGFEKFIYKIQQTPNLTFTTDSITLAVSGTRFENVNGYVGIDNAMLTNGKKTSRLDWFRLAAINKPNLSRQFQLHSNAFNATLKTNYDLNDLKASIYNAACYYLPEVLDKNQSFAVEQTIASTDSASFIDLDIQCFYTRNLFNLVLPQLEMARDASAHIHLGATKENDFFRGSFPQISYGGLGKINNLDINGKMNTNQQLGIEIRCDSVTIFQKNGEHLTFSNLDVQTNSSKKEVQFKTSWRNPKFISINELNHLHGALFENTDHDLCVKITDSKLFIRESLWQLVGDHNRVSFNKENFLFDQCVLSSKIGKISVNGEISRGESKKECHIVLDNFDISLLNSLTAKSRMSFGGDMSLMAILSTQAKQFMMEGKTFVKEFVFNEEPLGNLFLDADILEAEDPQFKGGIFSNNDHFNINLSKFTYSDYLSLPDRIIELNGKWLTNKRELRVHADMDTLRIGFLSPFLSSFSNVVTGDASGHLDFVMNKDSLYFDGKVKIKSAQLGITPLNTIYNITNQEVLFNRQGINFNQVILQDKFNNTATLSGFVHHNKFKDFKIDLNISTPKIMALNTPRKLDAPFFGNGFVSGDISIKGDTKQINFTSHNIKTLPGSLITFPLSSASTVSSSQGIYFVQSANKERTPKTDQPMSTELNFDFVFDITKDADVKLELDPIDGMLQCKTSGKLHLLYNTLSEVMDVDGLLSIVSGKFSMTLRNFFPRDFTIVEGGTISFSGPLTSAQINVSALYQKVASLSALNSEFGRTDVNAYLGLSGNLMNPNPSFTFAFPRLSETEQIKVFNVLDTANQQSGTRQFFSFVFLNTFMIPQQDKIEMGPTVGTGIDFAAGILNSLISDQLGNLNIGVNYINNQEYQEYSLNVQKNFYNDRIILKTNVGYAANNVVNSNNNLVGGLDLDVLLNDAGTWRMSFFFFNDISELNQNDPRPPQGGGISVAYRQAFNNRKDFIESWKVKKKAKKEK